MRAGVEALTVFEGEEEVSVFGGELGREHPTVGEDEVVRGDRIAVGPAGLGAEMEGPSEIVGRDLPAGGDGGDGLAGHGVVLGKAFEERLNDIKGLLGVGDLRIEIVGLGEVAEVEDLFAVAGGNVGLAFRAGGEKEGDEQPGGDEGTRFHNEKGKGWRFVKSASPAIPDQRA
jgi:hypothetical protein